jgi:hypothetical protein
MYIFFVIAILLGVSVDVVTNNTQHYVSTQDAASAVASAQAMGVLANAAALYQQAHPGTSGKVDASSLGVPAWFTVAPSSGAVLQAGLCYVYLMPASTAEAARLTQELTRRGFVAGIAQGSTLVAPGGASITTAPSTIPTGAVAIVQ